MTFTFLSTSELDISGLLYTTINHVNNDNDNEIIIIMIIVIAMITVPKI